MELAGLELEKAALLVDNHVSGSGGSLTEAQLQVFVRSPNPSCQYMFNKCVKKCKLTFKLYRCVKRSLTRANYELYDDIVVARNPY